MAMGRLARRVGGLALRARGAGSMGKIVVPGHCRGCGGSDPDQNGPLCPRCWSGMIGSLSLGYCRVCGHTAGAYGLVEGRCHTCRNRRPAVSRIVRVGPYDGALRELLLAFKFRGHNDLDEFFGRLLGDAMAGDPALATVEVLIPVPLHWRRYWSRGYNQAQLLALAAARRLGGEQRRSIPVRGDLLRVRNTPPQASLAWSQRQVNLRGAFAVRGKTPLAGRHVCLVDDVTTTGTTLRVAARALLTAGAAKVSAAVVAVAANDS